MRRLARLGELARARKDIGVYQSMFDIATRCDNVDDDRPDGVTQERARMVCGEF
jgi:hypothetical protein